jgi:predicted DCC family thiol-disulfide oxidoreductase YuxK
MSEPIRETTYRPETPLLVWDGNCGFCKYWAVRWERMTGNAVAYKSHIKALEDIPDISEAEFKRSVKLIEPDGKVYHAAEAVYRSLTYAGGWKAGYPLYKSSGLFRWISEKAYKFVAQHRSFLYELTIAMFGRDPARPRYYWLLYVCTVILLAAVLIALT